MVEASAYEAHARARRLPSGQPRAEDTDLPEGLLRSRDLGRVLAISPHLDDAALGCGALLAACVQPTVLTLFAGSPPPSLPLQPWDAACGFASGEAAGQGRRQEDLLAMQDLGATAAHLDFLDAQYGARPALSALRDAILTAIDRCRPKTVLFPLGLFHSDHALAHQAALSAREHRGDIAWIAYEEALYRRKPGLLQRRLAELDAAGVSLTPVDFIDSGAPTAKGAAVARYASQLAGVGLAAQAGDPATAEGYWRLLPRKETPA